MTVTAANFMNGQKNPLSPFMQAKSRSALGEQVNACPFGCHDEDLDDHGYCRHMIGVSADGNTFEPKKARDGVDGDYVYMDGSDPQPVKKTDRLILITTSSRVYRENPDQPPPKESK